MTKEMMKEEALKRMRIMGFLDNVVRDFKEDVLNLSENGGFLYWLNEEENKMIRDWEDETGNMAYHVIHDLTNFGELYTIMYVSEYEEEWEDDVYWLEQGFPLCYVINVTYKECSEYGSCGIAPSIGGARRVG